MIGLSSPLNFSKIKLTDYRALALCLFIGFLIRLVPELLAFSTPIGFDTIYYAAVMKNGVIFLNPSSFFTSTWLLNAIIVPLYSVFQCDPFLILKVVAPLLFGLNVAGMYWFSRKTLGWSLAMGLVAALFFSLQLASLRISWDLLRNTLGLGILLFAMSYIKDLDSRRGFAIFTILSLFAVFAHEYSAVILLATIVGLLIWQVIKKQQSYPSKRLALGVLPALIVFFTGIYLRFYPISYAVQTNVITVNDQIVGSYRLFFMTNYLQVQMPTDYYSSYGALFLSVALLFAVLYLPYIWLVKKGYFKNSILNIWLLLALAGSFSCLIVPIFALQYWHRWMFMLVYPFTFFAIAGLAKLYNTWLQRAGEKRFSFWASNKKALAMIILTLSLGIAYLFTPITMTYANLSIANVTGNQLYFSTDPAVPYQDEASVVQALEWLNNNMNASSCVILQHHYLEYGRLCLDKTNSIVYYTVNLTLAVDKALEKGFSQIYYVYWNQPIGWGNEPVPQTFEDLQDFDRISVYINEV